MLVRFKQTNQRNAVDAFTFIEVLMAFCILLLTTGTLLYGYVQANRMAEFSSISLAAQSYASQGLEMTRSAQWNSQMWPITNGPNTTDELIPTTNSSGAVTSKVFVATLDIPTVGDPASTNFPFWVTNYIRIRQISVNPPVRQIESDAVWVFALTGKCYTNSVVVLRAPDQ